MIYSQLRQISPGLRLCQQATLSDLDILSLCSAGGIPEFLRERRWEFCSKMI